MCLTVIANQNPANNDGLADFVAFSTKKQFLKPEIAVKLLICVENVDPKCFTFK